MKTLWIPDPYCKGHNKNKKKTCKCHFIPSVPEGMEYFSPQEDYYGLGRWYIQNYLGNWESQVLKEWYL